MYSIQDSDGELIKAEIKDDYPMRFHSEQEAEYNRQHGVARGWFSPECKVVPYEETE